MKKFYTVAFLIFLFSCSSPNKMGKLKYGKDGQIESGKGISKCTPPTKRYAKSLEAVVKGNIDSVAQLPSGSMEIGVTQAVTRLSDYSSEGLDIDLILFRICEMANNRGLSAEQVENLNKAAIDAWKSKKTSSIDVNNYGTNNGIMAGMFVAPETLTLGGANFDITPVKEIDNRNAVEIKTKQGVWYTGFFAYPLDEDSIVRGNISIKNGGVMMVNSAIGTVKYNGKEIQVKVFSSNSLTVNPYNGYLFIYSSKPSVLFFGDLNDPNKQFYVTSLP